MTRLPVPGCCITTAALVMLLWPGAALADELMPNGFDLRGALVPRQEIRMGGPPRDGIPALTNPAFVEPGAEAWLQPDDRVLGLVIDGDARAFPVAIMNYHEIVNAEVGGVAIAVTYCPLCGTGIAFDASPRGEALEFGVSGLLYNSDVLLYDRHSDSLWSQIMGQAVTGPMKGETLSMLPLRHTSWADWQQDYPATRVLSSLTGHMRDYLQDPYAGYSETRQLYQPVSHPAPNSWHPKERVLGIEVDGHYKAYPFAELSRQGKKQFADTVAGQRLTVRWDEANATGRIFREDGTEQVVVTAFWFAWYTFHPLTQVFEAP